jgi:hypothetical protein
MTNLPQPEGLCSYDYIRYELLHERFFDRPARENELIWVLKSKGRRKGSGHDKVASDDTQNTTETKHRVVHENALQNQRLELFLRGRIIKEEEQKVCIQYPKGSTYTIANNHILHILDKQYTHLVIVYPETPQYRRSCVVNTLSDEVFVEIGCGLGLNTERVYRMSTERVFGIDKSESVIGAARELYPHLTLSHWDVLKDAHEMPDELHGIKVDVLAVDINGTRGLDAVLECLQIALDLWQPRLVIVKSRTLHALLVETGS